MMHRFHGVQGKLCRTGAASGMILLFAASASFAEIKGMPKLDATQPIGAATKPAASASEADLAPPSFTTAQADRGRRAYIKECSDCHGAQLNDGEFGGAPLKGSYFQDHWGGMTVDGLYSFSQAAMPPNRPGSLSDQTYTDITTFLLAQNGYAATGSELPPDMGIMETMTLER